MWKRLKNRVVASVFLSCLIALAVPTIAETQKPLKQFEGVVNSLDMQHNRLVVDDFSFTLSNDTRVRRANGSESGLLFLTPGTPVVLEFEVIRHSAYEATNLVHSITVQR